jgi:hypothetical protein
LAPALAEAVPCLPRRELLTPSEAVAITRFPAG